MCPFRVSTTADIYSHLSFSSKLGIAETLTNILDGGNPMQHGQTSSETTEVMQKIFVTADINAADNPQVSPKTDFEISDEIVMFNEENQSTANEPEKDSDNALDDFRKAKEEMLRLNLSSLDEYFEYLDFQERMKQRTRGKSDSVM